VISRLSPPNSISSRATAIPYPRSPEIRERFPLLSRDSRASPTRAKLQGRLEYSSPRFRRVNFFGARVAQRRRSARNFFRRRSRRFQRPDRDDSSLVDPIDLDARLFPAVEHQALPSLLRMFRSDRRGGAADVPPRGFGLGDVADHGHEAGPRVVNVRHAVARGVPISPEILRKRELARQFVEDALLVIPVVGRELDEKRLGDAERARQ